MQKSKYDSIIEIEYGKVTMKLILRDFVIFEIKI